MWWSHKYLFQATWFDIILQWRDNIYQCLWTTCEKNTLYQIDSAAVSKNFALFMFWHCNNWFYYLYPTNLNHSNFIDNHISAISTFSASDFNKLFHFPYVLVQLVGEFKSALPFQVKKTILKNRLTYLSNKCRFI
jgi:hypothetical protein